MKCPQKPPRQQRENSHTLLNHITYIGFSTQQSNPNDNICAMCLNYLAQGYQDCCRASKKNKQAKHISTTQPGFPSLLASQTRFQLVETQIKALKTRLHNIKFSDVLFVINKTLYHCKGKYSTEHRYIVHIIIPEPVATTAMLIFCNHLVKRSAVCKSLLFL